jgi:hypothetical protein
MYEVAEKQQELFALRSTVFEQFGRDTVGSWSLVIGHAKKSLIDFCERESRTNCAIVFFGEITCNSKGETPETSNEPRRAAGIKDEGLHSAGPGFEHGRAGPRLSVRPSYDQYVFFELCTCHREFRKQENQIKRRTQSINAHDANCPAGTAGTAGTFEACVGYISPDRITSSLYCTTDCPLETLDKSHPGSCRCKLIVYGSWMCHALELVICNRPAVAHGFTGGAPKKQKAKRKRKSGITPRGG